MSKFLPDYYGTVYHCIPTKVIGETIVTSDKYGAKIPADVLQKLDIHNTEHPPLVFAATTMQKSLAFALQGRLQEKVLNHHILETGEELVIACDRENMLSRSREVTVFSMSGKNFVPLKNAENQCVSKHEIPIANTKIAYTAKNADDLMKAGLQILSFKESFNELAVNGTIDMVHKAKGNELYDTLRSLLKTGQLVWENKERNIRPSPALSAKLITPMKNNKNNTPRQCP